MNDYNMKQVRRSVKTVLQQCNPTGFFRIFPKSDCQRPVHMGPIQYKHLKRTNLYWKEPVNSPRATLPHFLTRQEFLDETRRAVCRLDSPSRLELWRPASTPHRPICPVPIPLSIP